ncbi:ornithine cyclodeaminase family protein [Palleronia rufa]|uniref:ornithine cyclodeaminase family protein n=1 Tax=Palleronia rufa TaxID=1530186 RepID=UPI00055C2603|nr:ornithine cyclodeaminase [Palleronia rufa]
MKRIGADIAPRLDWRGAVAALESGHRRPRAEIGDLFLGPPEATSLTRAARIEGLGVGVKSVTVHPGNPSRGLPSVQGAMLVFDPDDGRPTALIDSALVTTFKTAADSVLGARLLARPDPETLLIVGAGAVAASLTRAYPANFPSLRRIMVWARRPSQAQQFSAEHGRDLPVVAVMDLADAAKDADIISTATMAAAPVLSGEMVPDGAHVDLIGAFRKDMREADDALMKRGAIYVDSKATTIDHIGELTIPLSEGTIARDDILGDLYDLVADRPDRADGAVTVFKNGGGAHLDLMIADWIARHA